MAFSLKMFIPAAGWLSSIVASLAGWAALTCCTAATRETLSHSARVAWSSLFFIAMVVAWILRDWGKGLVEQIPWIVRNHVDGMSDMWYGMQAVYRVSFGSFLFFLTMAGIMAGVKHRGDARDRYLHHGNWLLKLALWLIFAAFPFLLPNGIVEGYALVARFGSGLFLIIQMVILLDFVQGWNDSWVEAGEEDISWLYALLGVTVSSYAGVIGLVAVMFTWFAPNSSPDGCSFNVALITVSLLLVVCISLASLHPSLAQTRQGGGSIFPASIISLYCSYLCFSSLQSEPSEYVCNGLGVVTTQAASNSTLAMGVIFTLLSVVYAAFRAGSNSRLFNLDNSQDHAESSPERTALLDQESQLTSAGLDGVPEDQAANREASTPKASSTLEEYKPISYNYSFFHLIFALASMYISMLLTGWGSDVQEMERLDQGWSSVWVKSVAQWSTASLYLWTLIAPALFPERDFA